MIKNVGKYYLQLEDQMLESYGVIQPAPTLPELIDELHYTPWTFDSTHACCGIFPSDLLSTTKLGELWTRIVAKYHSCLIDWKYISDLSENAILKDIWQKELANFYLRVIEVMGNTRERYETLLDYYANEKANLLQKVASISNSKTHFNDTPQNGGTYEDVNHATNVTKFENTSSSDVDTLMARLNEIDKKFKNIYKDWIDEFDKLFILDCNLREEFYYEN